MADWNAFKNIMLKNLKHTVCYWAISGTSGDGSNSYSSLVEVNAKIQKKRELVKEAGGMEIVSDTQVFLENTAVTFDEYIYLGPQADLTAAEEADPTTIENNCFKVLSKYEYLDDDANIMFIKVWL